MSFRVAAKAYDSFMGRYSMPLAPRFADFADIEGGPVLDVGCGPGALTSVLVERFGAGAVAAVDPSEPFVAAARERHPDVDVRLAPAEDLPFGDGAFAAALDEPAQDALRERCRALLPTAPFTIHSRAWTARGIV